MRPLDLVAARLDERGLLVSRRGDKITARCPSHEDHTPSLRAVAGHDDRALVHCHAGCHIADVLDSLSVEFRELFANDAAKPWTNSGLRRVGATVERDGRVRLGDTRYLPGAPNGTPKALAADGHARDLWPDPASVHGDPLFVVEGEPDAVTGATLGLPTVAVPGAAKWEPEWAARLAQGRERVVVIPDADEPGRAAAIRTAAAIAEHCRDVRILELMPASTDGYDLSDFAADARDDEGRAQAAGLLLRAVENAPHAKPGERRRVGSLGVARRDSPVRFLDVRAMVAKQPPSVPWLAPPLLPRAALTALYAPGGDGKSLFSMALAAAIAHGSELAAVACERGSTIYLDAENGEHEIHRRVHTLGLPPSGVQVADASRLDLRRDLAELEAAVCEMRPDLLVLDSFRSMTPGMDENDTAATARALDPLRRLAHESGAAILLIHHANKGGRDFRGSSTIRDAVDVLWHLGRHEGDPDPRRRFLSCRKMRVAPEPERIWLRLDVDRGRVLIDQVEPPEDHGPSISTPVRARLSDEILAAMDGRPARLAAIAVLVGRTPKDGSLRNALAGLVEAGLLTRDGNDYLKVQSANPPTGSAPLHRLSDALDADAEVARLGEKFGQIE